MENCFHWKPTTQRGILNKNKLHAQKYSTASNAPMILVTSSMYGTTSGVVET